MVCMCACLVVSGKICEHVYVRRYRSELLISLVTWPRPMVCLSHGAEHFLCRSAWTTVLQIPSSFMKVRWCWSLRRCLLWRRNTSGSLCFVMIAGHRLSVNQCTAGGYYIRAVYHDGHKPWPWQPQQWKREKLTQTWKTNAKCTIKLINVIIW